MWTTKKGPQPCIPQNFSENTGCGPYYIALCGCLACLCFQSPGTLPQILRDL